MEQQSKDQSENLRRNKQPSWLAQLTQGRLRGRRQNIKRGAEIEPLSSFGSAHIHTSRMYFPLLAK